MTTPKAVIHVNNKDHDVYADENGYYLCYNGEKKTFQSLDEVYAHLNSKYYEKKKEGK